MQSHGFEALIFDCDGTLVDSEPITSRVLAEMLSELGWNASPDEIALHFLGRSVTGQLELIKQKSQVAMKPDWLARYRERRNEALRTHVLPTRGALETVSAVAESGTLRMAVVSASDKTKVSLQLERVGLIGYFGNHIYSGHDVPRNKPYPDVYLNAAARMQVCISRCAVVEDSVAGIMAAVTAGATVFAYAPDSRLDGHRDKFAPSGRVVFFDDLTHLPTLVDTHRRLQ